MIVVCFELLVKLRISVGTVVVVRVLMLVDGITIVVIGVVVKVLVVVELMVDETVSVMVVVRKACVKIVVVVVTVNAVVIVTVGSCPNTYPKRRSKINRIVLDFSYTNFRLISNNY